VTHLPIDPLSDRETSRIAQARLGVDQLPQALAKLITAKAEGNALFAEEIASFLEERGTVRRCATGLEFDPGAVASALPESVQSLLTSRVDRLPPADRALLQGAAVIGRRFDPELAAVIGGAGGNAEGSFAAMEGMDLIHRAERSNDYVFKHALVRDALYTGLLSDRRAALHLKAAEELERRSGNRLIEIAESLAHHYAATSRDDKAFAYLAMAGHKSLDVYSIEEAEQYFRRALDVFERQNACADRASVAQVIVRLLETLLQKNALREIGICARKFMPVLSQAGETPELAIGYYFECLSCLGNCELRIAHELAVKSLAIAESVGDGRARPYARGVLLLVRTLLGVDIPEAVEQMKAEVIDDCLRYGDRNIRNGDYLILASDYLGRGLNKQAREVAMRLIAMGGEHNDPRAIGFASQILALNELVSDNPIAARSRADDGLRVAVTELDRMLGRLYKLCCDFLLEPTLDSLNSWDEVRSEFERLGGSGWVDYGFRGVALAMLGQISGGIRTLKQFIVQYDANGFSFRAICGRIYLAEIYIQILSSKQKPSAAVLLRNLWTIIGAMAFGARRARALLQEAAAS